ncbi:hypothetical protein ABZ070_19485 [Streptomyces sp. NPDC006283]|uniref:hypothetical protein n=1 Tax=Streptomyces sp. NPDC006283 TaxID=3156741 RepID=UPI0033B23024
MLALRLARGAHPLVLLRRLMVAAAAAGVGFLLLCTLTYALSHPDDPASVQRLLWCAIPLAVTVYLAVAVARTDPGTRPRPGLATIGLGPVRLAALAAASTALSCTLGSMLALLVFLHLRGDLSGLPFDGAAAELLDSGQPLPPAGALTLLALVPLAATTSVALVLRPRPRSAQPDAEETAGTPAGLPWGVALIAVGLAAETYASGAPAAGQPAGVLVGWILTAVGLWLAGPAVAHLSGRLLQSTQPGATRLLAGRILMEESRRIGRPLGVVCAVASGAMAATAAYGSAPRPWGPMTALGATLVVACTTATLATAALEAKQARSEATTALLELGAPATTLRNAAVLRAAVLVMVFTPLTLTVGALAAAPLAR